MTKCALASNACAVCDACRPYELRLFGDSVSFIHIPKVAGSSTIQEFRDQIPVFYPGAPAGREHCLLWDQLQRPHYEHFVILRSPRAHVWSQFAMCKYAVGKMRAEITAAFPRTGTTSTSDDRDFMAWVSHFSLSPTTRDNFNCYHPQNMQARYMTCSTPPNYAETWNGDGHNVPSSGPRVPPLAQAKANIEKLDVLGSLDFMHETICLVYSRLAGACMHAALAAHGCACSSDGSRSANATLGEIHTTHHALGHRDNYDFEPALLEQIDSITQVDRSLYLMGLQRFMCEMRILEQWAGHRVLCDDALSAKQHELAYMVNITQLYHEAWPPDSPGPGAMTTCNAQA